MCGVSYLIETSVTRHVIKFCIFLHSLLRCTLNDTYLNLEKRTYRTSCVMTAFPNLLLRLSKKKEILL
jgi:hypothetical protein